MRKIFGILIISLQTSFFSLYSQSTDSIEISLLTCFPGLEIETVYGHSALRVINHNTKTDEVYSWGVYDFAAPHFAWNFAKGRQKYQVKGESINSFLDDYFVEQRAVLSQKINLSEEEKYSLIKLINTNLLPENRFYLYDFFYKNCATKIRDLIEQTVGTTLVYPTSKTTAQPTFRDLVDQTQKPLPWLTFGTDLLIGMPADKEANFREQMFLPEYLMKNLSAVMVSRNDSIVSLLQKPVNLLSFENKENNNIGLFKPFWLFSILAFIVIFISIQFANCPTLIWLDKFLFLVFSALVCFMIFFNFFTDHATTKMNLNIIWLNPFLFISLYSLFANSKRFVWFRIISITSAGFIISLPFIPQTINLAFIPIIMIMFVRSISRSNLTFIKQKK